MNFNDIATRFYTAGTNYSAAIQPYAVKLFVALLLIDILVTWIQFTAEGQLDASHFLGRLIKHILSGGFVYLMIVNAFSWMNAVLKSFSAIGASVTGLPALNPQSVLKIGVNTANIIFNSPGNASMMTNFEQAIVQSIAAFIVLTRVRGHSFDAFAHAHRILSGSRRRSDPARTWSEPIHRPCRGRLLWLCHPRRRPTSFFLPCACHRRADGERVERCSRRCLQTCPRHPPLVDHIRFTAQLNRHDRLLWNDSRFRHAQLCSSINRLYDRLHRRSSHGC